MRPPRIGVPVRRLGLAASASAVLGAFALGATAAPGFAGSTEGAACGASATATIAAVVATTAEHIYANELAGTEVSFDLAQITGAGDLESAVAADNAAETLTAVERLVYHPAWHIVRLRVLNASGQILADLGGPYVIAPVAGVLRYRGRVVGSFLMSVQDDTGFTKLETRYVGDPIGIYFDGGLVAERYASFPPSPPSGPGVTLGNVSYLALRETYNAFPSSTLTALILIPPASARSRQTCAQLRAGEFGRVAERLAQLAVSLPQHYQGFATTVHNCTGADVFVRENGIQVASSGGLGPLILPSDGTVSYQGTSWLVFSFEPHPATLVYVLAPPA